MALTLENLEAMSKEERDDLIARHPHLVKIIEKLKEDSNE